MSRKCRTSVIGPKTFLILFYDSSAIKQQVQFDPVLAVLPMAVPKQIIV